jgi:hypothetical protein
MGWLKFTSSHGLDNLSTTHTINNTAVKSGLVYECEHQAVIGAEWCPYKKQGTTSLWFTLSYRISLILNIIMDLCIQRRWTWCGLKFNTHWQVNNSSMMSCCHNHGLMCHQAAMVKWRKGAVNVPKAFPHVALHAPYCCSKYQTLLASLMSMLPSSIGCIFFVAVLPSLHSGSQCRHPQEIDTKMAEVYKLTRPWQLDHYSYHKHALQWHQASCTYANRLSYAHCSKNRTFLASAWMMSMLTSSLDCIVKVNVSSISKRLILGWLKFTSSHSHAWQFDTNTHGLVNLTRTKP